MARAGRSVVRGLDSKLRAAVHCGSSMLRVLMEHVMSSQHVPHASIDFNASNDAHASIQFIVPGWMRSGFVTSGFSSCRASRVVPSVCSAPGQGGAEQLVKGGNGMGGAACRPQVLRRTTGSDVEPIWPPLATC